MASQAAVNFGMDPRRERKRVLYVNSSGSSHTLVEGEPFAYNYDATQNILGYDKANSTFGQNVVEASTTAEGYQNEGKYLIVEDMATANLFWFAGVSAAGNWNGKTIANGSQIWIEIFTPNGAIVPVYTNVSCTVGTSVLGVANASQYFSSAGRPVAVAEETVDRSSTAGIVLAKLCPDAFLFQTSANSALKVGAENATTSFVANTLKYTQALTGGTFANVLLHSTHTGNTSTTQHNYSLLSYLSLEGTYDQAGYNRCVLAQLNLTGTWTSGGQHIYPIMAQLSGSAPTLTTVGHIAGISVDLSLGVNPTTGNYTGILIANNGANQTQVDSALTIYGNYGINNLFDFESCAGITANFISNGGTGGATKVITSGGDWKKIKISIDGSTYYLLAMVNPSEIDNT